MAISLHRLRYFQAIVSSGSFSAAARDLNIAQPALSYHIHELEEEFGASLLVRSNKGVELTPSGLTLSRHASDILRRVDEAEHEIRAQVRVPNGNVTVALAVTMARHLVPVLLRIVDERYPQVSVKFLDVGSVPATELMKTERVELALVPHAAEIPDIEARPMYREPLSLIERARSARPSRDPIRFYDLGSRPLVLSSRKYDLRRRVEEAAIVADRSLDVRYEQESIEIIRAIVQSGLAGTITQAAVFHPASERPQLDIRKIIEPEITRTHCLVRRRDRSPSLAVNAVATALNDAVLRLISDGTLPGVYCGSESLFTDPDLHDSHRT